MREIKFKVWDYQNNRWAKYSDCYDSIGIEFGIKDYFINIAGEKAVRFAFCQYTGLKDKAGNEIYEGDILENPEKKKGVVVFYDGCFRLQIHKSGTSVHYITMNQGYCENKTIIANSYENPELFTT